MNHRYVLAMAAAAGGAAMLAVSSLGRNQPPPPPPPVLTPPPPPPPGGIDPLSPEQVRARGKCVGISASVDPTRRGVILVRAWEDGSFETRLLGAEAFTPSDEWRPAR
jgi:hypothetical protein